MPRGPKGCFGMCFVFGVRFVPLTSASFSGRASFPVFFLIPQNTPGKKFLNLNFGSGVSLGFGSDPKGHMNLRIVFLVPVTGTNQTTAKAKTCDIRKSLLSGVEL